MSLEDILIYWRIIQKRLWLISLLLVVTVVTMVVGMYTTKPEYQTSLRFQVTAIPPNDVSLYLVTRVGDYREEIAYTRANFMNVLTSAEVAWQVIDELGLRTPAKELLENVEEGESLNSDITRIIVTAKDPQLAADIANMLFEKALFRYGEMNSRSLTLSREFISRQLEQTREELVAAQADLVRFQTENSLGSLDGSISAQHSLIRSLELAHDEAVAENNQEIAATYEQVIAQRKAELQELIQHSTEYATLESRVRQLRSRYNLLLEKDTEARLKENEALNLGFIQALGPARVPTEAQPRISFPMLALGGVIALVVGVMAAFLWEYLERKEQRSTSPSAAQEVEGLAGA